MMAGPGITVLVLSAIYTLKGKFNIRAETTAEEFQNAVALIVISGIFLTVWSVSFAFMAVKCKALARWMIGLIITAVFAATALPIYLAVKDGTPEPAKEARRNTGI